MKKIKETGNVIVDTTTPATLKHSLKGDDVVFDGPLHLSWHELINQMTEEECVAVIDCVKSEPYPCGRGTEVYSHKLPNAEYAIRTNGGRTATRNDLSESEQTQPCSIVQRVDARAYESGQTRLGTLRLMLAVRSKGAHHGPWDSYVRIAVGALQEY